MNSQDNAYGILIAALGGEGGGVLADWLVQCALRHGLPVQATSVPGVAQRTGATSYYIELLREPAPAGATPVFGLTPVAGRVDVVVASELLEAARMVERGFVTARTTLLASTHRIYTTVEKMHMADGRQNPQRLADAARALARKTVLFDMEAVTTQAGTVISAVMFGSLAGAGVLPWPRSVCEDVIRASGKGVQASLAGFAAAFDEAAAPSSASPEMSKDALQVLADGGLPQALQGEWAQRLQPWPAAVQLLAAHGALRCRDYQNGAYAQAFLDHVQALVSAATPEASAALEEAVRHLALWMCFEDVIRVADLKTRRSRYARVTSESQAQPGDIVRVTEHFKPGVDEVAAVLPRALGEWLVALATRRGWMGKAHVGLHIRSTSLWGYLMLRSLAWLRPLRPRSLRYAQEHETLSVWLAAMRQVLRESPAFALVLAGLPQVLKGYGDTQARGRLNYARLWSTHVVPALSGAPGAPQAASDLSAALKATLADPEGKLNQAHRAPASNTHPVFWAAKAPHRETTLTPRA
ncbi:MAG: indolepyruvate oxidoreductase subunit beta family protein [Hydrogenophaga sp.]|jgi:indolepyruvate ferredoxin oxidoreductase beta subunit|uniref:indolepyruvate oxidoreductase subunit beta family protein n=1 Tax=Hydrogenophaga sp. TaxID=1904254 RepID=UPI001DFDE106|nr:indolepyruvate oxidoreductase subunit beta family protein [Hydrogenophaga sp.]MBW0170126.1 indolepyruvate oxidoreductase subunit beta family protein [Hydrogenophaga sp.]MBW0182691.1 indolepyruvate oxidoreductase subunit beta family protein [Hydrogenophaga sp.]